MSHPHAEFPLGPFAPYDANPILRSKGDGWESSSVYNPAAVVKDDKVVLLYRAHADDIVSHVVFATSDDGSPFDRHREPVLSPSAVPSRVGQVVGAVDLGDPRVLAAEALVGHFGEGSIYHAWPDDLIHWTPAPQDQPIMLPTPKGTWFDYYGQSDSTLGVATYKVGETYGAL